MLKFSPFALLILCLTNPAPVSATEQNRDISLPDIGDSTGRLISPVQDRLLGRAFMRSIRQQVKLNEDPEVADYIRSIGNRLTSASDDPGRFYYFFVVMNPQINAFAGPGGYIGIHSGLILESESESELASVIAHEIAHVTQKHLYQAFEDAKRFSLPTAAAMLAALLVGSQSPELGQAAVAAIQAGSIQRQINFTRNNEQEADSIGMQTLARSNFSPHSMPDFFEKLQQSSRFYGKGVPEFLRTHPVTASRIAETRSRAESYPYHQVSDTLNYQIIKTKLLVASIENSREAIKLFERRAEQGTERQKAIARYGLALSLHKSGNFPEANRLLETLVTRHPQQSHFHRALAKAQFEQGEHKRSVRTLEKALKKFPALLSLREDYGAVMLELGETETAQKALFTVDRLSPSTPKRLEMIAQSYAQMGDMAQSHRYLGEAFYLNGHLNDAIKQMKLAQTEARSNFYLQTQIDERLKRFNHEKSLLKR